MISFLRSGGVPILVVLLFGLLQLVTAIYGTAKRDTATLKFARNMAMPTLFATISATLASLGATFQFVASTHDPIAPLLCEGLAESMSAGILGCSLLAMSGLTIALGERRATTRAV